MKTTRCYLMTRPIHKRRGGISDLSSSWFVAEWFARGTGTLLYTSKQCRTRDEAKALAGKWLERMNKPTSRMDGALVFGSAPPMIYVDTTDEEQAK